MIQPVRDKLGVQNAVLEIHQYEQKWLQHLQRMDTKQDTQGGATVWTKKEDKYRAIEKKTEGPTSPSGLGKRYYA
jgi:hypothetical protein